MNEDKPSQKPCRRVNDITGSIDILFLDYIHKAHNGVNPYRSSPGQFPRTFCGSEHLLYGISQVADLQT